jgi:hypothetical protein
LITSGLQPRRKFLSDVAASALAGVLILVLLWAGALAASPSHQEHHLDRGAAGHHVCAVCLYAHGQIIAHDFSPVSAVRNTVFGPEVHRTLNALPATFIDGLPQERAPPTCFS